MAVDNEPRASPSRTEGAEGECSAHGSTDLQPPGGFSGHPVCRKDGDSRLFDIDYRHEFSTSSTRHELGIRVLHRSVEYRSNFDNLLACIENSNTFTRECLLTS